MLLFYRPDRASGLRPTANGHLVERVTLAADGRTANFNFTPDEQQFKCMMAPDAFAPIPNVWGRQGWTTVTLSKLSAGELKNALETAWTHAQKKRGQR